MDAFCRSYALNKEWIETGEGPVTIMEEIRKDYDGLRGRGFEHENSPLFEEHFNTINSTRIESEKYKKNRDMLNFINTFPGEGIGLATGQILSAASKDLACIIALKALLEMSEPDRWRAVAMLKEMNDPDKKEEGP